MADEIEAPEVTLELLRNCFEGAIPIVIATVSADGTPNVTYLSKAHLVDDERIALSNQFLSKSARNLAEHPRASLLFLDPITHNEARVHVAYERTERRGPVFDELRADVDAVAALTGMEDVFRLRSADIYRVQRAERVPASEQADGTSGAAPIVPERRALPSMAAVADLCGRLTRCGDLDSLVNVTVDGLAQLLGYEHSMVLLLDEAGERLFTIASHGYAEQGVGSEVRMGDGVLGTVAKRCEAVRMGNAGQMVKYAEALRRTYESSGVGPGREIPLPGLARANSCAAVPIQSLGQLVGVLFVEAIQHAHFEPEDEAALTVVASVLANAIEAIRAEERSAEAVRSAAGSTPVATPVAPVSPGPSTSSADTVHVRFFPVDGSTFLEGDYLIKGVAGRILWALLGHYERDGRVDFTNREVRLDPSLDLPDFRDNFESRLILLKRRLDERDAPIRIEKTGRGRFRLVVETTLRLDQA
ncbi:MAG: GAF domain-containing protein [Actinomycetota bacterium]|nr:GAF domain-containing protein [Actinomycetota bacterium]